MGQERPNEPIEVETTTVESESEAESEAQEAVDSIKDAMTDKAKVEPIESFDARSSRSQRLEQMLRDSSVEKSAAIEEVTIKESKESSSPLESQSLDSMAENESHAAVNEASDEKISQT